KKNSRAKFFPYVLEEPFPPSGESSQMRVYPKTAPKSAPRFRCRLMQVRPEPRHKLAGQNMSIEDDPKKLPQDDAQTTPEWHRARAKDLLSSGFAKMAEEHEHIARTIERQRREQQQTK